MQVILICDNAPGYSRFEVAADEAGIEFLRLDLYLPMLNPIEKRVVKARVKMANRAISGASRRNCTAASIFEGTDRNWSGRDDTIALPPGY